MLNNIPKELSPELVKCLMEMGHGDEILLADGNYPALTNNDRVIRADGLGVPTLLEGILKLMPLDTYSDYQAILMETVEGDPRPDIWDTYKKDIGDAFPKYNIKTIERQNFYKYSKGCFAIIQTGETALYGNLILKKGVVVPKD
ncbi:fucose operon FucU protein [Companilactobacillus tucceti DSM 20183]|uniref:Fucose operon FucU protein n=1 Tax=Companilactobacillus tucceti DSM 20183 TaxID=1423811 RepID=A0A0R1IZE9_9LACO|nr:RbsD/FucU domain-containing protein [Companilactobacillus tucceti]KRK64685.1 fucose operon FucU protein [Companilactobacillus tucceti DSM 20183]